MAKSIVIAVDTEERTLDAIALGRVLAASTNAPTKLVTVFPYAPLVDRPPPRRPRGRIVHAGIPSYGWVMNPDVI